MASTLVECDGSSNSAIELPSNCRRLMKLLRGRELTVAEAVDLAVRRLGIDRFEAARALYRLREAGLLAILDPNPPRSFLGFLFSSRASWFWLLVLTVVLTDLSIYTSSLLFFMVYLRYVFGSLFVLYLPGASLIELLYPRRGGLSQLERLALSIGLSLALVPLVGLVLNYTPWGIRLNPIVVSLTFLTLSLSLGAVYRKYKYHLLACGGFSGG